MNNSIWFLIPNQLQEFTMRGAITILLLKGIVSGVNGGINEDMNVDLHQFKVVVLKVKVLKLDLTLTPRD